MADALAAAAKAAPDRIKPAAEDIRRGAKKNYAQALSNELALMFADRLMAVFPKARVTPRPDGTGQEFSIGAGIDRKKIDVGVWDDAAGLILGMSIKTYTFRDASVEVGGRYTKVGRYNKNVVRNDHELRSEADVLHRRQRYAVLIAVMFLPRDACWDGLDGHSSFAHQVFTFRKRAGRTSPDHPRTDLFERMFIGLFTDDGAVRFFDVHQAPPNNQPPPLADTVDLDGLLEVIKGDVRFRNTGFRAADEQYAPTDPTWVRPDDTPLPVGLDTEPSLSITSALDDSEDDAADQAD
jgi:hypothetical protein